jgi:glycosyltransferase involved in cell wall biosynthesis
MAPYTILHAIETAGPGGAETVVLELASHLDPSRFRSIAILPPGNWLPQALQGRGIPTRVVKSKSWHDSRLLRTMTELIRKERVDLIHSHLPDQNFYSCIAGLFTRRKTIVTYHGDLPPSRNGRTRRAFKEWIVRHTASKIVVVSEYLKGSLLKAGAPREKLVRIYNGIDSSRYSVSPGGVLRRELGCLPGSQIIGMVANMRKSKGLEYFVRAARIVSESFPQTHFVVAGETEIEMEKKLSCLVRELSLDDRFTFLGFREDIPQVLAEFDVFALASVSEGLSIATIEAMASGRPVVVTRSGGPQEIVEDRKTGLLVPPADPHALASGICELLRSPQLAERLGKSARAEAESRFSRNRMVREYESLYESCLVTA